MGVGKGLTKKKKKKKKSTEEREMGLFWATDRERGNSEVTVFPAVQRRGSWGTSILGGGWGYTLLLPRDAL